eukprot:TRINITY_DN4043_c0_g2_i2.p1 TRINITY_DN4043_c0_g2~~TRINITY_DN4043_c0_g2_i2.p1  ORF type:complete len:505 (-),score=64.68 TRINITY_DN4043_c0_g2_i2:19-1332(-)
MAGDSQRAKQRDREDSPGCGSSHRIRGNSANSRSNNGFGNHAPETLMMDPPPLMSPGRPSYEPSLMGGGRSSGTATPLIGSQCGDPNRITAEKVAQVQDIMRQRLQSLQDEQHRQWQRIQEQLQSHLALAREAAEDAMKKQMETALDAQLKPLLGDLAAARRDCEAQSHRVGSMVEDIDSLRRNVVQLQGQGEDHTNQLQKHTIEIERLWAAHQECARFRQEMQRDMVGVQESMAKVRAEQDGLSKRVADVVRTVGQQSSDIDFLKRAQRQPSPAPAPAPAPPPPPVIMPEVSEEAYAVLKNSDGEQYELPALKNVVGRSPACSAVITHSQAISNKHASLDFDSTGQVSVRDLGSRNGTFLNEKRVPQEAGIVIESGDAIQLGVDGPSYVFEFGPAYYARWPSNAVRVTQARGNATSSSSAPQQRGSAVRSSSRARH